MHGLPSRPSPGPQAFCIGGFGWRRPESIFLKRTLDRPPEGLSILAGTGAGHPPLWCPTMALKIKIARDSKGDSPWHAFAFFLRVKKEGGPQARLCCGMSAHTMQHPAEKDVECAANPFSAWRKDTKDAEGFAPRPPGN